MENLSLHSTQDQNDSTGYTYNAVHIMEDQSADQDEDMKRSASSSGDQSSFFPYHLPSARSSFAASSPHSIPLIDEMLEGMALSMLIFLMADLRLLSATGRISLKWESMILDNDLMLRTTANQVAGLMPNVAERSCQEGRREKHRDAHEGLSPAQLMAMVLVETKKTIDLKKQKEQERHDHDGEANGNSQQDDDEDETNHGPLRNRLDSALHAQQQDIFSPVADIAATGQNDELNPLLKAYVHMVAQDMNRDVPSIEARRSTLSLLIDPKQLSLDEMEDEDDEFAGDTKEREGIKGPVPTEMANGTSPSLPRILTESERSSDKNRSSRKLFSRKTSMDHSNESQESHTNQRNDDEDSQHTAHRPKLLNAAAAAAHQVQENVDRRIHELQERRKSMMMTQKQRDQLRVEETTDELFGMGQQQPRVRASVIGSLDSERLQGGLGRKLSSEELLLIMERAVESRVHNKLDFMSSFFRRGTICRIMCKSNVRVVWINDWYPLKDLTYAIAVDKDKKRLLVVFRGAITKQDWSKAIDAEQKIVKNPIAEDFEGRPEKIGIFSGFYQYLFRKRKDTGTTKYDEIVNLAHQYGVSRIGQDYHLAVTGHSLGAGLSTVFSFYASTEERFTRNGPVRVISFGSPMIGDNEFADCFRHQEELGKIMYARFYNHNDLVAYLPANMLITKRGSHYRHVGIGVRVPRVPRQLVLPFGITIRRRWKPSVYYIGRESFWASYCRGISRNALLNAPWFWQTQKMHTLMEMLKRLMGGSVLGDSASDLDLLKQPIETIYQDLAGFSPTSPKPSK